MSKDRTIKLPKEDADIDVVFPNGKTIVLQWRVEGPSLDILLPETLSVHNWRGSEMKPAKRVRAGMEEVRQADQLCIPLLQEYAD
jgi:hypothetical protein